MHCTNAKQKDSPCPKELTVYCVFMLTCTLNAHIRFIQMFLNKKKNAENEIT